MLASGSSGPTVFLVLIDQKSPGASYSSLRAQEGVKGHPPELVILFFFSFVLFCFVSEQEKTTPPGSTENIEEEIGELGQAGRLWLEKSPSPMRAFAFATLPRSDGENTPGLAISCMNKCTPSQIFRFLLS